MNVQNSKHDILLAWDVNVKCFSKVYEISIVWYLVSTQQIVEIII